MRAWIIAAAVALIGLAPASAQVEQAADALTFVQAGSLLADPATGAVETDQTIVIQNGRVLRIEDGFTGEGQGLVVDLRDSFVLPGLIDSHVHLTGQQGPTAHGGSGGCPRPPPTGPSPWRREWRSCVLPG